MRIFPRDPVVKRRIVRARTLRGFRDQAIARLLALVLLALACAVLPAKAATFTVTRGDDPAGATTCAPGDCTLRAAILAANASPEPDTIAFSVPTDDPYGEAVLVLERDLPPLTGSGTTIDGFTQPSAAPGTSAKDAQSSREDVRPLPRGTSRPRRLAHELVAPEMRSATPIPPSFPHHLRITLEPRTQLPYPYVGLTLAGTGHEVRGLAIRSFYYAQIDVRGSGHRIRQNLIGLAANERVPYRLEPFFGIRLRDVGAPVAGNTIGGGLDEGNVFGHVHTGISLVEVGAGADVENRICANLVGIAPDGVRMLPITRGIEVRDSAATRIGHGGPPSCERNLVGGIGGRDSVGVQDVRAASVLAGNTIGGTEYATELVPHHLAAAIDADAATSLVDNTLVERGDEGEGAPDTISFARALALAPGTIGTTQSVLVRRTGPAATAASVDVLQLGYTSVFATEPSGLALGSATLSWEAGDTSARVVSATFLGYGAPGPYGDAATPKPYGTELVLALANPLGATLGAARVTRLTLHAEGALALDRFDAALGPASASFE